jgi:hypothetical protein
MSGMTARRANYPTDNTLVASPSEKIAGMSDKPPSIFQMVPLQDGGSKRQM